MTNSLRRVRRTLVALLFICASAHATAYAQQAYKIDDMTRPRCDLGEVPQITDDSAPIFAALANHPAAKAAVVVYGLPGEAIVYARNVRRWLTGSRGIVSERLLDIYGGPAASLRLELWLVPVGAAPPTAAPPAVEGRVTLFDRYDYWPGEYCGPDRPPSLNVFAETLKSMPGWSGTIVVRPHVNRRGARAGDEHWDESPLTRRDALRRAAEDRLHLVRQLGLGPARIRAVVGAPGEWAHAELWLIPPAAGSASGGR
jgi:hypothetical protein